jgi:glyoxylase-like metal-dependent hydrolase (beta-lactamase superfamily II)
VRVIVTPVTLFQQNCSLVWCESTRRGAIVDPGGDTAQVLAAAAREGVTIEKLLVTHAHIDHAGATAALARELGVPIEGPHRDDQFWIDLLPEQGAKYGFPAAERFEPSRWLEHGDTVTVGQLTLDVVHCPGHTPGPWCSTTRRAASRWSGTCCSRAPSDARISRAGTTRRC